MKLLFPKHRQHFYLFFLTLFSYISYAQKPLFEAFNYPIGFAVSPTLLKENSEYLKIASFEANSITCENMMKAKMLQPEKGVFTFEAADYIVNFAAINGKRVHGHTLVWYHTMAPQWMKDLKDSAVLEQTLKNHIQTVVSHFKGRVSSWDVVNESFTDKDGLIRTDSLNENKKTVLNLGKILGKDYIARMFNYAHQADPKALLFYNDYGQENHEKKQKAILNMVKDFKNRGVPIHGLGLQMHTHAWIDPLKIEKVIKESAETGLLVHISELDIIVNKEKKVDFEYTEAEQQKQAKIFESITRAYQIHVPPNQQYGITFWNIGDADSWLNKQHQQAGNNVKDYPLLFDHHYKVKKLVYDGFLDKK